MSEHSHLDQQRRPPGDCRACDEAWAAQAAIVERHRWTEVAERHNLTQRVMLADLGRRRYGSPR